MDLRSAGGSRWKRPGAALAVIAVVGAAVRITRLVIAWDRPLSLNDSLYYSAQARALADGRGFVDPFRSGPGAEHGPVTTVVMALVSWVDEPVPWQRAVTVPFGIATVVLVALAARRVAGDRAGLVAGSIAAVYPNLWLADGIVMSESISIAVVAALLLVLSGRDHWSTGRVVAAGVLIGVGALTRSELVVLAPLVAWIAARRGQGRRTVAAGAVLISTGLVVAPWAAFNLGRFERPVLLTTNEGMLVLGTNSPDTYGGPNIGGWSLESVLRELEQRPDVASADGSVRSAHLRAEGLAFAGEHWHRIPLVVAARIGRLVDLVGIEAQLIQDEGEERARPAVWAGIVVFWAMLPLSVVGARRLWRRSRPDLAVAIGPVVVALVTAAAFYGTHRLRSTAEPSLVVLSAVGAVACVDSLAARGRLPRRHRSSTR